MPYIRVENITRVYNSGQADELTALSSVSLSIDREDVVVLTGPSGSGKSSLLSSIGCMSRPTEGKIVVDGRDVVKLPEHFLTVLRRENFGFIFQQFHLIRELTVMENVMLPLYPLNMGIGKMKKAALLVLDQLRIGGKMKHKIKQLSGGEQQRVAIARALVNTPGVIIADEPTAHLDRGLAREFMDILGALHDDGKTIIIATHDPFIYSNQLVTKQIALRDGLIVSGN